jgi:hypothetical protein
MVRNRNSLVIFNIPKSIGLVERRVGTAVELIESIQRLRIFRAVIPNISNRS